MPHWLVEVVFDIRGQPKKAKVYNYYYRWEVYSMLVKLAAVVNVGF